MYKIINEDKSSEGISFIVQEPHFVSFKSRTIQEKEDLKNITIYKATNKYDNFYLKPVLENILDLINITNYDFELIFFDELDSLCIFEIFIFLINKAFNTKCLFERNENQDIKISVNGQVILCTNML
ncbi:hypothetical protein G9O61_00g005450 [Vairimorpha ceranae]|nr:hypothetical protein G9O61_00g005450 [Vairimorpha ceranae]